MEFLKKAMAGITAAVILVAIASAFEIKAEAAYIKYYVRSYGKCRVTAYSGNNGVTYGASGNTLEPNISVAASRNIPLGTELYIEDFGIVTVEDRTAKWYDEKYDGMIVDLYLESYDAACEWGVHELQVYVVVDKEDMDK